MTMITPSYLGETIEYSSLHACRSTLEDPTEEKDCRGGGTEQYVGQTKPALRIQRRPAVHRGGPVPAFPRCQARPSKHFWQHRMLAIDPGKVSLSILLNSRPFGHLVLRQTVEVNPVDANSECQDRQKEYNRRLPIPSKATRLDLTQHICSGLRCRRDGMIPCSMD